MLMLIAHVIRRELLLNWRARNAALGVLLFFVLAASVFALGIGADRAVLQTVAPGVLWVTALFAALLSAGHMFGGDFASGALEQMVISPQPLAAIVLGKIIAHWIVNGLALTLLAPLVALEYGLDARAAGLLMISLLLGTPLLSLIGSMGAALTLGVRGASIVLALLVLPLYVPVLVFGVGAASESAGAAWTQANLSLLAAALALALWLCPFASAAALRISME